MPGIGLIHGRKQPRLSSANNRKRYDISAVLYYMAGFALPYINHCNHLISKRWCWRLPRPGKPCLHLSRPCECGIPKQSKPSSHFGAVGACFVGLSCGSIQVSGPRIPCLWKEHGKLCKSVRARSSREQKPRHDVSERRYPAFLEGCGHVGGT